MRVDEELFGTIVKYFGFCKWLEGFLSGNEQNTEMTEQQKDQKILDELRHVLYGETEKK